MIVGFHTTITITTNNNKSPHHHISTLHTSYINTNTQNNTANMGNGAKAASKRDRNAKDAAPVAKSQLKSVRLFFSFAPAKPFHAGVKLIQKHRILLRRPSSAKSASRTSSRRLSVRLWKSTPPTNTARSTRIVSLLREGSFLGF